MSNAAFAEGLSVSGPLDQQTFPAARASSRGINILRAALIVASLVGMISYGMRSIHWPMMVDSPIMHYVNFLMDHGMKPYSQITDMNMPGAYLVDSFEMRLFGPGDLALRIYVFVLGAMLIAAMIVIALPYDWLAGLYAGGFFVLLQGAEGPKLAGEREQVIATLLMVGYALLFTAVRRRMAGLTVLFGFVVGMAVTIKPTIAPLPIALLLLLAAILRRRRLPVAPYVTWSIVGMAFACGTSLLFLARHHAFGSFFFILRNVLPSYATMKHPTHLQMLATVMPVNVFLLLALASIVAWKTKGHWSGWGWERLALGLGATMGLVSYFAQNKGFLHHRYIFLCFLLLLLGLEFTAGLRSAGVARLASVAGLLFTLGVIVPRYLHFIATVPNHSDYTLQLEHDLQGLGGGQLQGRVLCLDLVYGCLNSLYHLGLVENTGYTGDLLLFSPVDTPAVVYYRAQLMQLQAEHPAAVVVVSNEWLERPNTFSRLDTWPGFGRYLQANYTQVLARQFPLEGRLTPALPDDINPLPPAYRIYVRNGESLLEHAQSIAAGGHAAPVSATVIGGSQRH